MSNGSPSCQCGSIRLCGRNSMRLFCEERREVGGQAIDDLLPLLSARRTARTLEPLQVAHERAVAGFAQTARQAAVDHRLLAGVQAAARALVDELANALEVGVPEAELLLAWHHGNVGPQGLGGDSRQDNAHECSGVNDGHASEHRASAGTELSAPVSRS